jgi:hypothetical protein
VKSTFVEPAIVKSIPVEPTAVESAKSAPVESAPVESTKSAPVEAAHRVKPAAMKSTAPAVETPATTPAVRPGVGGIWLAERGSAQQSRSDRQSPSYPGPGSIFV